MLSSLLRAAFILALFITAERALAVPRYSLVSGTRCSACHFTPHGGGLRTELGWGAMNEEGAWRWPWQAPRASSDGAGEASDEDLFNAPQETAPGEAVPEETAPDETAPDGAVSDETGVAPGDEAPVEGVDELDVQDPLPAHEETDVPVEAPEEAPDDSSAPEGAGDTGGGDGDASSAVHTNSFFDGLITPGVDVRLQYTKIGRPPNERRLLLPMQTQVYLAVTPVDWLAVYGGYNASTIKYSYAGQSAWEATAQFHPGVTLPTLRVGYMQPSIGIRHDDHTMFTRRQVAGDAQKPLIPPGYAELGAELTYEGMSWLTVNAGVFGSKNLADIEPSIGTISSIADFSKPSVLGRVMLWPQDLDLGLNGELGASFFGNGDFRMINVFAGLGLSDRGSVLVEGLMAEYPGFDNETRKVRNVSIMGSYHLFSWLDLIWRYEWGQTEDIDVAAGSTSTLAHAHQAVFGAEFFPLPYVEIRPEYRFFQTEPFGESGGYLQGQYTIQLHLFY